MDQWSNSQDFLFLSRLIVVSSSHFNALIRNLYEFNIELDDKVVIINMHFYGLVDYF